MPEPTEAATVTRSPGINSSDGFPAMQSRVDEILNGDQAACSASTVIEVVRGRDVQVDIEVMTISGTIDEDRLELRCR